LSTAHVLDFPQRPLHVGERDRQASKDAPAYDENAPFGRDAESVLYDHYGRKVYWHHERGRAVA
jgi:hypothetical protein